MNSHAAILYHKKIVAHVQQFFYAIKLLHWQKLFLPVQQLQNCCTAKKEDPFATENSVNLFM